MITFNGCLKNMQPEPQNDNAVLGLQTSGTRGSLLFWMRHNNWITCFITTWKEKLRPLYKYMAKLHCKNDRKTRLRTARKATIYVFSKTNFIYG